METETLEAKLRNQLTPLYGLADMVLALEKNPKLMPIIIQNAEQVNINKRKIEQLLSAMESKDSSIVGEIKLCECTEEHNVNIISLEPPIATCTNCGGVA